jgi:hypothetical protein
MWTQSNHSHILIWRWIILIELIWWFQLLSRIKNMNIIINITKISLEESNVEKRSLRTKIEKYLHRVRIVEDSKTLKLLRQTIVLLTINSSSQTINNKDSKLYDILQRMQTIIEQLQKMRIRHRNQKVTRTLWDSSSNWSRCQNASKNASRNSSIRRRSNRSENSRSTSLTTKKERNWKKWSSKHHEKNARRKNSIYHSTRKRCAENTDEIDED